MRVAGALLFCPYSRFGNNPSITGDHDSRNRVRKETNACILQDVPYIKAVTVHIHIHTGNGVLLQTSLV